MFPRGTAGKPVRQTAQSMRLCGVGWRIKWQKDHAGHYRLGKDASLYSRAAHETKVYGRANNGFFPSLLMLLLLVSKEHSNNGLNS